jgi:multidrug efflux pump subunit AcrA (membrane-fusion protein)
LCSGFIPLCNLCVLCGSVVNVLGKNTTTKGTEKELSVKFKTTICSLSLILFAVIAGCQSACQSTKPNHSGGIAVVNSPVTGRVKRIVVAEGVHVETGTPIIEIVVQAGPSLTATPAGGGAEAKAIGSYQSADAEIAAARAEAVRHEAEVARLTPLVNSGEASQGELDGERALYEQAQRRLTQAQEAKRNAEGALLAARQPNQSQPSSVPSPGEQVVSAVAGSPGRVAVINARIGDLVKIGEPLATIRADH